MNLRSLTLATSLALALAACGDSETKPVAAPTTAPSSGGNAVTTEVLKAEAEKLLANVATYIKENKWDLAEKAVARLEEIKPQLPPEYGPRIDQLKQGLATAKAAAQKLPAIPGGGG